MNLVRTARYALLVAVVALPPAACSTRNAQPADPTSAAPTTEFASSPSLEPTGAETPGNGGRGGVSVSLPSLPIGGRSSPEGGVRQCVPVNWLAPRDKPHLPDGVSVSVTGIQITPPGSFKKNGGGCGGAPGCDASFAFTSRRMACSVSVTALGTGGSADLSVTGRVNCPAAQEKKCRDLAAAVTGDSIPLEQPAPPDDEQQSSSEESPPTTTS